MESGGETGPMGPTYRPLWQLFEGSGLVLIQPEDDPVMLWSKRAKLRTGQRSTISTVITQRHNMTWPPQAPNPGSSRPHQGYHCSVIPPARASSNMITESTPRQTGLHQSPTTQAAATRRRHA